MQTGIIQQSCPWFFEIEALIGERPNINPISIGNSTTDIDMDSYHIGKGGSDDSSENLDFEIEIEELEKELVDDEIDKQSSGVILRNCVSHL